MLNVTAQRSADGAKGYFAKSDYYSDGQELVGNWGGKGAVLLGLFGEVDKAAFDNLCDNINPKTGNALTRNTQSNRRVGYDFTWSSPKSASVVHALTGDNRIIEAFLESVHDTMNEMEIEMQGRVRKGDADFDRTTGNFVSAEFLHLTSRPVNGLPCPQMHSHVWVWNATYDVQESTWKAGQFGRLKSDSYFWQAVQQARFAENLQRLGYATRKTKDAFEIVGVPETVLKKFSLRTLQIDTVAEKLGITDPKAKAKLAATTREAKLDSAPYPTLIERWAGMLSAEEWQALHTARGNVVDHADRSIEHVRFAIDHTFERSTVVDERRLMTLALRHGIGSVTPDGVRKATRKAGLLRREKTDQTLVTTEAALAMERKLLDFAVKGKGSCQPMAELLPLDWERQLPSTNFSDEQRRAVRHFLTSPDRVMILAGQAGTGKTTLTTATVEQMQRAGRHVVMLAPSANASRGVLRAEGFHEADTLSRFLIDKTMQAQARDGVIWVDEAGLCGTKTISDLFETAKRLNARIVLAGDTKQMSAVQAGTPLHLLQDVAGLKVARLSHIRRQDGAYRDAVKSFAAGNAADGISKLHRLGWIKTLDAWEPYKPVAREFVSKLIATKADPNGVLIVSPTHAQGQKIVEAARVEMRAHGLIHGDEHTLRRLVPLQWSEAERSDRESYTGDEILQLHRTSGAFRVGDRVLASDMLASLQPPKPSNFAAYRDSTIALAAGDIICITANGKTQDHAHKLNNGAVYTVAGFTPAGDIKLNNSWVLDKEFGHWTHGIVSTAQGSQGRTVQHVIVCQGSESLPASSREGLYVAVSRARQSATVYCDSLADLQASATRSQKRLSATELAARPRSPWWKRMQGRITQMRLNALIAETSAATFEQPKKEYTNAR